MNKIKKIMKYIVELLFPACCPGCGNILIKNKQYPCFCKKCRKELLIAKDSVCMKCGKILTNNTKELCETCEKENYCFRQGKGIYGYTGCVKLAMYRFKYSNKRAYARIFAKDAKRIHGEWIRKCGVDFIVDVPMYERKKRVRGYNQAEIFAKALSAEMGIEYKVGIVRRKRDTKAMKQLNKQQRVNNLQNAFTIAKNDVKFRKVLLVDDIYTTGATMNAVSKEILKAGAEEVYCLSVSTAVK